MKRNVMMKIGLGLFAAGGLAGTASADVSYSIYAGFVSRDAGTRNLCMTAGPQIAQGLEVVMEPCDGSSPTVYATALDQLQINLTPGQSSTYVCLDDVVEQVADVGTVHYLVWDTCGPSTAPNQIPSQSWNFRGGVISNDGTGSCLWQHGAGALASAETFAGACQASDTPATSTTSRTSNLWMPIWYDMYIAPITAPGDCLTNLKTNYNSDTNDTQYTPCKQRYDQTWRTTFLSDFSSYVTQNHAGWKALDVFGAQIQLDSQGLPEGVVDMADPNGTAAQFWYFSELNNGSPQGYSLLMNELTFSQHMCLNMVGQNPANTNILFGCHTQYGFGTDPAEQVQATIPGFTH
jgi:hypothetical protein